MAAEPPQAPQAHPRAPHLDFDQARFRARAVAERHLAGKRAKGARDLTAELYLCYIDGSDEGQWLDIHNGAIAPVPRDQGAYRTQENVLGYLVAAMVAYHTSNPLRVVALPLADRQGRMRAKVDTLHANDLLKKQRVNELLAAALGLGASAYGHGLIHVAWRDEGPALDYETVAPPDLTLEQNRSEPADPEGQRLGVVQELRRGYVDFWLGDPWETVYDEGATRFCVHRMSYVRTVPLSRVKQAFRGVPGVDTLTGSTDLPSASRVQRARRLASQWLRSTTRVLDANTDGEELVALVFEETVPGLDPEWPEGRLSVVALGGQATGDDRDQGGIGNPVLLSEGRLPGKGLSGERFYACGPETGDDVHGKPWIEDKAPLQLMLNQLLSRSMNYVAKLTDPLIVAQTNMIDTDDLLRRGGVNATDVLSFHGGTNPYYLQVPQGLGELTQLQQLIETKLFRMAGFQAASRGEGKAGQAAAAVVALAQADDTVHAPAALSIRGAVCRILQRAHLLAREHMSVPYVLRAVGRDVAYLASGYVHATELSAEPPEFEVTSSYGTPESRLQQLLNLISVADPQGNALMTRDEFWEMHPDPSQRPLMNETARLKRARALKVNDWIRTAVASYRKGQPDPSADAQAMQQLQDAMFAELPVLRDDDMAFHIDTLSEITQDPDSDPLAFQLATVRQDALYQWQAQEAQSQPVQQAQPGRGQPAGAPTPQAAPPDASMEGNASTQMDPGQLTQQVQGLTAQAQDQTPQ